MLKILGRAKILNTLRFGTSRETLINEKLENYLEDDQSIYVISQKRKLEMIELSEIIFGLVER